MAFRSQGRSRNPFNQVTSKKSARFHKHLKPCGVVIPLIRSQVKNKNFWTKLFRSLKRRNPFNQVTSKKSYGFPPGELDPP